MASDNSTDPIKCFLCGTSDGCEDTCQYCLEETNRQIDFCSEHQHLHQKPNGQLMEFSGNSKCYPYEVGIDSLKGRYVECYYQQICHYTS